MILIADVGYPNRRDRSLGARRLATPGAEADRLERSPMEHAATSPAMAEITRLVDVLSA